MADLARAYGYPYPAPAGSYLYRGGGAEPLAPDVELSARTPVLAFGSNRSPEQLARKFGTNRAEIPVTAAMVADADVVYSAHVTGYGSLPAMLTACEGVTVTVHITWLTNRQLERMHLTEGRENYSFEPYQPDAVSCALRGTGAPVHWYRGRRGAFAPDGSPLALAAVSARGRRWPGLDQRQVLDRARLIVAPTAGLDDFVRTMIVDGGKRASANRTLAGVAARADRHATAVPRWFEKSNDAS